MLSRRHALSSAILLALASPAGLPVAMAQPAAGGMLEEIVVSAQRRQQVLIDVPISMSVIGEDALDKTRARTLEGMQQLVPNFSFEKVQGYNNIAIRGVGGGGRNIGFETRAGVYIDGVYIGQPQALGVPLFDVQRVEVLRGPQGHLFGRNTVSGAVNIVTRPPGDEFAGYVMAGAGNGGLYELQASASGPLGERVGGKLGASWESRDGFTRNLFDGSDLDGIDRASLRGQLSFMPTDALTIDLHADYANIEQDLIVTGEPLTDFFDTPADGIPRSPRVVNNNTPSFEDVTLWGASLTVDYQFDNGLALTSISAWRDTDQERQNDSDYSPADILWVNYQERFRQFSEELRLASPDDGAVRWLAGIYYLDETAKSNRRAVIGQDMDTVVPVPGGARFPVGPAFGLVAGSVNPAIGQIDTRSWALFASLDYDLTERLTLNVGLRYTDEKKDLYYDLDGSLSGGFRIAVVRDFTDERKDSAFTPSLGLQYALTDAVNLYAKYSTGFKSGGWNLDFLNVGQAAAGFAFEDETVKAWELGIKSDLGIVSFEAAVFTADYKDHQVFQSVQLPSGTSVFALTNAARARARGVELSVLARPADRLTLAANLGLVDAKYRAFPDGGGPGVDLDGNRLQSAPRTTGSLSVDYSLDFAPGELALYGEFSYRASSFQQPQNQPLDRLESRNQVNARATWYPADGNWSVSLWGNNLFDRDAFIRRGRDFLGNQWAKYNDPRTYGVELRYDF
ncbi:MAG: TonB-dependent receptor [Gammaproteobacteria bacterium]|nr:TonB-dependent receptor [Gammaproteobacteria bacterium]